MALKKAIECILKTLYGAGNLEANLFEGYENGIDAVTKFDEIELRTIYSTGFALNQRDTYTYVDAKFMDDTMLKMGNLHSHGRFVHYYINGEYRGLYYLRERMDADFMKNYFGGVEEDYEAIDGAGGGNLSGNWDDGVAFDGTGAMYNTLTAQADNFDSWKNYLNTNSYFDFMLSFMWGNHENEMKACGNLTDPSKFTFRVNDADGIFTFYEGHLGVHVDRTDPNASGSHNIAGHNDMFKRLYNEGDNDFFMAFADRVECNCFNDGPLTPNQMELKLDELRSEIELGIVADVAVWGDELEGEYPSVSNSQITQIKQILLPNRTDVLIGQLKNRNFYPSNNEAVNFNQFGGTVNSNFQLVLSNPNSGG